MLVDTHAHLQWASFNQDREEAISRARNVGVEYIVNNGFNVESSVKAVELAEKYKGLYATVGIHPHNAVQCNEKVLDHMKKLCENKKVVAIGEIGLDFYRNLSPREVQKKAFRSQFLLALKLGLPVVIHDREAHTEILHMLSEFKGKIKGIMHCFSGNWVMAEVCIKSDFCLSFAGSITYPMSTQHEIVRKLDLNKILLETDSPWLAPQDMRGKRNEPAFLPLIAQKIAKLKDRTLKDVAEATTLNAKDIFQLTES